MNSSVTKNVGMIRYIYYGVLNVIAYFHNYHCTESCCWGSNCEKCNNKFQFAIEYNTVPGIVMSPHIRLYEQRYLLALEIATHDKISRINIVTI